MNDSLGILFRKEHFIRFCKQKFTGFTTLNRKKTWMVEQFTGLVDVFGEALPLLMQWFMFVDIRLIMTVGSKRGLQIGLTSISSWSSFSTFKLKIRALSL